MEAQKQTRRTATARKTMLHFMDPKVCFSFIVIKGCAFKRSNKIFLKWVKKLFCLYNNGKKVPNGGQFETITPTLKKAFVNPQAGSKQGGKVPWVLDRQLVKNSPPQQHGWVNTELSSFF